MSAIIFDTETTGLKDSRIIEAAWIKVNSPDDMQNTETFEQRYNPGKPIELGALATHHILDAELADCPSSDSFTLPEGTEYIIGHNIDYDWKSIGEPPVKRICTLALSRTLYPEASSHSQSAMFYFLYEPHQAREALRKAHSAFSDANNCKTLLQSLLDAMKAYGMPCATWEDVWNQSENARKEYAALRAQKLKKR